MSRGGYELLDCGNQLKLERFADLVLSRPSSQSVWGRQEPKAWQPAATFERDRSGTGRWHQHQQIPNSWRMKYFGLDWTMTPNDFGNLGIFPEQKDCWRFIEKSISDTKKECHVLNLFAYTGGSTLVAARAGAHVVHLDASKTSVAIARDNAKNSDLAEKPIRWITDDAVKFVDREIRRGRRYHGIVLDPPSYGRGTGGEVWAIERDVLSLVEKCQQLLADDAIFFLLTSHSPGFTPLALENLLLAPTDAKVESAEMVIASAHCCDLPSGAYARWRR